MEITYDIVVDNSEGPGKEILDSWISSKAEALSTLAKQRRRGFKEAYLVKCVQTRYREARSLSPKTGQ